MRALTALALVSASFAAAACTSTYHPEYHPVTVTSYEQHVGYPAAGRGAAPGATFVAPAPPPPPAPSPWSAWPSDGD